MARRRTAGGLGKTWTTSVRRLISRFSRSSGFAGRARAREAARGCPRRVHHRLRRGRQGGRHLLRHPELAQGGGRQDPSWAVRPQALRGDGVHLSRRGTALRRRRGARLRGVRRLVPAAAGLGGGAGQAGRLPGGGRALRAGRDRRVRRSVFPPAAGGQAPCRRRDGGRRIPGQRGPGHRPGDGHPVAEAAPRGGGSRPQRSGWSRRSRRGCRSAR